MTHHLHYSDGKKMQIVNLALAYWNHKEEEATDIVNIRI